MIDGGIREVYRLRDADHWHDHWHVQLSLLISGCVTADYRAYDTERMVVGATCTELQLYRAGKSSAENLSLAYDLAWNRMDVFLHGSESAVVRSQFGAEALIQKTFEMLQQHEAIIEALPSADAPELAAWEHQLLTLLPEIRQLMILNFTGPGATRGMDAIDATFKHISWMLAVVSLLSLLMSYLLFL